MALLVWDTLGCESATEYRGVLAWRRADGSYGNVRVHTRLFLVHHHPYSPKKSSGQYTEYYYYTNKYTGLAPGHATARALAQQQAPGNGCRLACVQSVSRDTS